MKHGAVQFGRQKRMFQNSPCTSIADPNTSKNDSFLYWPHGFNVIHIIPSELLGKIAHVVLWKNGNPSSQLLPYYYCMALIFVTEGWTYWTTHYCLSWFLIDGTSGPSLMNAWPVDKSKLSNISLILPHIGRDPVSVILQTLVSIWFSC